MYVLDSTFAVPIASSDRSLDWHIALCHAPHPRPISRLCKTLQSINNILLRPCPRVGQFSSTEGYNYLEKSLHRERNASSFDDEMNKKSKKVPAAISIVQSTFSLTYLPYWPTLRPFSLGSCDQIFRCHRIQDSSN